jgi:hypothetical protein
MKNPYEIKLMSKYCKNRKHGENEKSQIYMDRKESWVFMGAAELSCVVFRPD